MHTVYAYKNCDTCRRALRWLAENGIPHEVRPIRETPPGRAELEAALEAAGGNIRGLFNTSGADYRQLGLKDRLAEMDRDEALGLLAAHGNLVKRPFLSGGGVCLVGFDPAKWREKLL